MQSYETTSAQYEQKTLVLLCVFPTQRSKINLPAAPRRKKFHSGTEISSAFLMISTHSMKENTSLSFSNRPLKQKCAENIYFRNSEINRKRAFLVYKQRLFYKYLKYTRDSETCKKHVFDFLQSFFD